MLVTGSNNPQVQELNRTEKQDAVDAQQEVQKQLKASSTQNDNSSLSKLGGACISCAIPDLWDDLWGHKHEDGSTLVDKTLKKAMAGDKTDAVEAMENFSSNLSKFKHSELETTKNYIVSRIAKEPSLEGRNLLHKMYHLVDTELNKPLFNVPKPPVINPLNLDWWKDLHFDPRWALASVKNN